MEFMYVLLENKKKYEYKIINEIFLIQKTSYQNISPYILFLSFMFPIPGALE